MRAEGFRDLVAGALNQCLLKGSPDSPDQTWEAMAHGPHRSHTGQENQTNQRQGDWPAGSLDRGDECSCGRLLGRRPAGDSILRETRSRNEKLRPSLFRGLAMGIVATEKRKLR